MQANSEEAQLPPWGEGLIASTRGISEPHQRMAKLVESIREQPSAEIAQFFRGLSLHPNSCAGRLHTDLIRFRDELQKLGYEKLLEVYQHAYEQNWIEVKALLQSNPIFRGEYESIPEGFSRRLESLTMGEKKQLSRDRNRKTIELLVFDSSPMVIEQLLQNPSITEKDVIRIAARHQAPIEILEEICKSDRWSKQYSVRKALVFNPKSPLSYALGFLGHLRKEDVRLLVSGGTSRKELIAAAQVRLKSD